ncbi:LysE family translocator [Facilibium subflavum]|uniref:LysE family translocator n=1 Tax=Facilibium subflavum TaxID=2219058 RepID=UPI000E6516DD|nr:LysE family translocator [Facilibium subflavum]
MTFLLALVFYCVSTTATPGPNNFMIMLSSLRFGIMRSLPHFLGICFGFPIMVIAVGMGLKSVFDHYPVIHTIIKYLGAIYMLYLAVSIIFASTKLDDQNEKQAKPLSFINAVLFQWVNPKAWVMAIAAIATYTQGQNHLFLQVVIIAFVFFIVTFPSIGFWLVSGKFIKKFVHNQTALRLFNVAMGILLIASIALLIFDV